jgi:hypothetical protein
MKKLVLGAALAGGAAFAFHRLAGKARKMHDHCREMMAGRQESTTTVSPGCGS